ncbi:MAG: hypothetical protein ACKOCM_00245 [Cyanobacteriota bacterium]
MALIAAVRGNLSNLAALMRHRDGQKRHRDAQKRRRSGRRTQGQAGRRPFYVASHDSRRLIVPEVFSFATLLHVDKCYIPATTVGIIGLWGLRLTTDNSLSAAAINRCRSDPHLSRDRHRRPGP